MGSYHNLEDSFINKFSQIFRIGYARFMTTFFPDAFFAGIEAPFKDLLTPSEPVWEALKKIPAWFKKQSLGRIEGVVSPQAFLINPELIVIGKGTVVEAGAYLQGPLWIGENCTIRHGAYLRGNVIAADGVVIGHDTETKNSIFLKGAHAAHFAYVGDSILGAAVNLGAGVKLANLRLNGEEISVEGERTGLRKLGSIVGDKCQIGCNVVLNPGTFLGKEVDVMPLVNVGGFIPDKSRVKQKLSIVVSPKK